MKKLKKGDYEKMFQIPKRYINDDINRLYKGIDWIIDTINDGDMRALLYYPYIEFCGRKTDEDFSGFVIKFWFGHDETIPDSTKKWKTWLEQIDIHANRGLESWMTYSDRTLEIGMLGDHITKIRESTYRDFSWLLENDDSPRQYRKYKRRDMSGLIYDEFFGGEHDESTESPLSKYPMVIERMKVEAAKPTFRKPEIRDFKKGQLFARKRNRIDVREPVQGNYAEIRDIVSRLNKYAVAVSKGNPGPIIETPALKKQDGFYQYNVNFCFGKDYVANVLTVLKNNEGKSGSYLTFDSEGSVREYVEGNLIEIDPIVWDWSKLYRNYRRFVIDGTGTEVKIHPNGFLSSYRKFVKNRLFGRQITWNDKGEVITDENIEVPKNRLDKPTVRQLISAPPEYIPDELKKQFEQKAKENMP
ncbi:MAG: hypothetical protein LBJ00_04970 [Planctomycetaceae bacterium]|nr:hypothetical protein [Planctomycetaceae bacterium]